MQKPQVEEFNKASLREEIPNFRAGDAVKVHVKVTEGNRSRVQIFQGIVIARRGANIGEIFTVRELSFGTGVGRTFPLHASTMDKIEVVSRGNVHRTKLYRLHNRHREAAEVTEKHDDKTTT